MRTIDKLLFDLGLVINGTLHRSRTVIPKNDAAYIKLEIMKILDENKRLREKLEEINRISKSE